MRAGCRAGTSPGGLVTSPGTSRAPFRRISERAPIKTKPRQGTSDEGRLTAAVSCISERAPIHTKQTLVADRHERDGHWRIVLVPCRGSRARRSSPAAQVVLYFLQHDGVGVVQEYAGHAVRHTPHTAAWQAAAAGSCKARTMASLSPGPLFSMRKEKAARPASFPRKPAGRGLREAGTRWGSQRRAASRLPLGRNQRRSLRRGVGAVDSVEAVVRQPRPRRVQARPSASQLFQRRFVACFRLIAIKKSAESYLPCPRHNAIYMA